MLSGILTFPICITFTVFISVTSSLSHFHYVIMYPGTVPWLSQSDPYESVGKCKNLQTFSGAPFGISITVPSVVRVAIFIFI